MANEVLASFLEAAQDPWAARDGNVLLEKLRAVVRSFISSKRDLVIDALMDWLASPDDTVVIQAAILTKEFRVRELAESLGRARDKLAAAGSKSTWILDEALDLITNT